MMSTAPVDLARLLDADEEVRLILANRPADCGAEQVVAQRRLVGGEEVAGVHLVVAEILEQAAVELVRAGLGGGDDESAGRAAEFGRVGVLDDAKFADHFHRRIDVHLADAHAHVLTGSAVEPEHLALHASAGEREIGLGLAAVIHPDRGRGQYPPARARAAR